MQGEPRLLSRRRFVRGTALAAPLLILPSRLRAQSPVPANSRLRIAMVGVGSQGKSALAAVQDEQIVAFCDVDWARGRDEVATDALTRDALARFPEAKWYHDYRLMFEQMADQIDAVTIAVPDHMHFPIAMAAVRLRKHIYVEKPLCRCVAEIRALRTAAREAGVVTQMGNQGRTLEGIRLAREWIQAGLIGRVHTVHACNHEPGNQYYSHPAYPETEQADPNDQPPSSLHYDLWLGVAPERPYRASRSHGVWRGHSDFGSGRIGDWGCHQLDAAFFALDLDSPLSVEAATTEPKRGTFPLSNQVTWKFAARGERPAVEVKWFDGDLRAPSPHPEFKWEGIGGSMFYGEKGALWVKSHSVTARLVPESRMQELHGAFPPRSIPRVEGGPHREWLRAIHDGGRCGSNFEYAAPLAETVQLGLAAIRAGVPLQWDAAAGRVTNHAFANQFIGPGYDYRPGWGV